jgi:hypothetical protein
MGKQWVVADPVMVKAMAGNEDGNIEAGLLAAWLFEEFPRLLRINGGDIRGFSFTCKEDGWLLTVRLQMDGTPAVVFVHRVTPIGCIEKLKEKWEAQTFIYLPDRFA